MSISTGALWPIAGESIGDRVASGFQMVDGLFDSGVVAGLEVMFKDNGQIKDFLRVLDMTMLSEFRRVVDRGAVLTLHAPKPPEDVIYGSGSKTEMDMYAELREVYEVMSGINIFYTVFHAGWFNEVFIQEKLFPHQTAYENSDKQHTKWRSAKEMGKLVHKTGAWGVMDAAHLNSIGAGPREAQAMIDALGDDLAAFHMSGIKPREIEHMPVTRMNGSKARMVSLLEPIKKHPAAVILESPVESVVVALDELSLVLQ